MGIGRLMRWLTDIEDIKDMFCFHEPFLELYHKLKRNNKILKTIKVVLAKLLYVS